MNSDLYCSNILKIKGNSELLDKLSSLILNSNNQLVLDTIEVPHKITSYSWRYKIQYKPTTIKVIRTNNELYISFLTLYFPPLDWLVEVHNKFSIFSYELFYNNEFTLNYGTFTIIDKVEYKNHRIDLNCDNYKLFKHKYFNSGEVARL